MISKKVKEKGRSNPCWEWPGKTQYKYALFFRNGSNVLVHRALYELLVGAIPEGLVIDHLCRNRRCVNPFHLEAVTDRENILRGEGPTALNARKTHCKRGHHLTPENVRIQTNGGRQCRPCLKIRGLERTERHREKRKQLKDNN